VAYGHVGAAACSLFSPEQASRGHLGTSGCAPSMASGETTVDPDLVRGGALPAEVASLQRRCAASFAIRCPRSKGWTTRGWTTADSDRDHQQRPGIMSSR
jgi:hypothetical protein